MTSLDLGHRPAAGVGCPPSIRARQDAIGSPSRSLLLLCSAALASGCEDNAFDVLVAPESTCAAGPRTGCESSADCERGLVCAPEGKKKVCRVPTGAGDGDPANVLMDGFGADRLRITVDREATFARVVWGDEPEAVAVECALFSCTPEIRSVPEPGEHLAIVNVEKCALKLERFDPGDPVGLDLGTGLGERACRAGPLYATQLLTGCWVYGESAIVSASRLHVLAPGDVRHGELVPTCDDVGISASCLRTDETWGTCSDGTCCARCDTDSDCAHLVEDPAAETARCSPTTEALGVCVGEDLVTCL